MPLPTASSVAAIRLRRAQTPYGAGYGVLQHALSLGDDCRVREDRGNHHRDREETTSRQAFRCSTHEYPSSGRAFGTTVHNDRTKKS